MDGHAEATLLSLKNRTGISESQAAGNINLGRGGSLKVKKPGVMSRMQSSTGTREAREDSNKKESQLGEAGKAKVAGSERERSGKSNPVSGREKDGTEGGAEQRSETSSDRSGDAVSEETSEDVEAAGPHNTAEKRSAGDPFELDSSEEGGAQQADDEEKDVPPTKEDKEVLEYARKTGKLPCVLWQPNNPQPTFCEKDLPTGRYTVLGEKEDMTATDLIKLYGPKGGWQNRMPNAIHIVRYLGEHKTVPPSSHPDDHASHGEWYEKIWKKGEMYEIEKLHKERAGIKTKTTVKKRRESAPLTKPKAKKARTGSEGVVKEKAAMAKRPILLPGGKNALQAKPIEHEADSSHGEGVIVEYNGQPQASSRLPGGFSLDIFMKLDPSVQRELIRNQGLAIEGLQKIEESKRRSEDLKMMAEILGMSKPS